MVEPSTADGAGDTGELCGGRSAGVVPGMVFAAFFRALGAAVGCVEEVSLCGPGIVAAGGRAPGAAAPRGLRFAVADFAAPVRVLPEGWAGVRGMARDRVTGVLPRLAAVALRVVVRRAAPATRFRVAAACFAVPVASRAAVLRPVAVRLRAVALPAGTAVALRLADAAVVRPAAVFLPAVFLAAVFLPAACVARFDAVFLPAAFVARFDAVFLAAPFFAGAFFTPVVFAAPFFAGAFFAPVFFAGAFLAAVFFPPAAFLAPVDFFVGVAFVAPDFLAGAFFATLAEAASVPVGAAALVRTRPGAAAAPDRFGPLPPATFSATAFAGSATARRARPPSVPLSAISLPLRH
jgi:hypothetical protein